MPQGEVTIGLQAAGVRCPPGCDLWPGGTCLLGGCRAAQANPHTGSAAVREMDTALRIPPVTEVTVSGQTRCAHGLD